MTQETFNLYRARNYNLTISTIAALILIIVMLAPINALAASSTCKGRFVNPISDICWSCIMPVSIGRMVHIGNGMSPKERDTKNPKSPVCMCIKENIPVPGISIGFWEPVRLVDITRTPFCMTNLGGITMGSPDMTKMGGYERSYSKDHHTHNSFYHVHYYVYPLIYWLELLTDFICLEKSTFDVAYMSEFDVTWNDEKLQSLLNPEAILFGNPIAQAACALDCVKSTISMPIDNMFWCAGCLGNMYPFSGANADHVGGVQSSSLYTTRIIAKMHRIGLAQETSTDEDTRITGGGKLCRKNRAPKIKKSQYKLQMVNPSSSSSGIGCWPIGLSDMLYSSFKEYPNTGQDWGYLIWRKKNCCAF